MQRDLSVKTIHSRATADTMEGSLIAPPFKFGVQKQYRLNQMDSRQRERRKAETTLKEGAEAASPSKTTTKAPNAAEEVKKWLPHPV